MKFLILVLCVIGVTLAEQSSPLFLWNVNSVVKPALGVVSQDELAEILRPFLAEKALIVFREKELTNKHLVCSSTSCFAGLQGVPGKNFYASVDKPIETLRSVSGILEDITVDRSGKLSSPMKFEKGTINIVDFEDDGTSGSAALEWHDSIIASLTSQLKNENVFFAYTSDVPSSHMVALRRERRETAAISSGFVFRKDATLLVFYSSLSIIDNKNAKTPLDFEKMDVQETNSSYISVTLSGGGSSLAFDVTLSGGYFFMKNVKWNNVKFRSTDVYSPTDFSYFCGNLTLYGADDAEVPNSYTLKWNSLQFQAPFGYTKDTKFVFGDPWHCVGFFTGGILSGLLIVALLLSISFVGVCWMMDINTMDRFDDPKGKTITINASE